MNKLFNQLKKRRWLVSFLFFFLWTSSFTEGAQSFKMKFPLGLKEEAFVIPQDNPMTQEKIDLGRFLYFDKRLSKDNSIACASCHIPALAFTDGQAVSSGIKHFQGGRSAPTVINRGFSKVQFWDGRAASLEEQALGPLINPVEHGFSNHSEVVAKLKEIKGYRNEFKRVFGTDVTIEGVGKAIATFERTVISGNSPFDQFETGGKEAALSDSEKQGLKLFRGKARCSICHAGFNFTDERFHNLGVGWDTATPDLGRYLVTKKQSDIGAFKTPTLREIANTAPYMHDGRFGTLEDVVLFYDKGGIKSPFQDPLIVPLNLSEQERRDLVAFLRSLSGEGWQNIKAPIDFPQ